MSDVIVEVYTEDSIVEALSSETTAEVGGTEIISITEPGSLEIIELYLPGELVEVIVPDTLVVEVAVPSDPVPSVSDTVELVELTTPLPPQVIEVVVPGEQGPRGLPGISGAAATGKTKNFATPSDTWEFTHDLGYVPNVSCSTADGKGFRGHVEYNDEVQTVVSFYSPVAGRLILS